LDLRFFSFMSGRPKIPLSILDFSHLYLDVPKFHFRSSIFLIYVWTSQNSTFDPRFFSFMSGRPKIPFSILYFSHYHFYTVGIDLLSP
jgi:hypothetical protein